MYQTMTEKALLTVEVTKFTCVTSLGLSDPHFVQQTKWIQNREFILVLVAANYSICHDPPLNQDDLCKV